MAAVSSYQTNALGLALGYTTSTSYDTILEEEEEIELRAELDSCCANLASSPLECQQDLTRAKSVESLNSLLSRLPDIVIPETLHNPLPLQCLAFNALPEIVREDIDGVLSEFSSSSAVMDASSPARHLGSVAEELGVAGDEEASSAEVEASEGLRRGGAHLAGEDGEREATSSPEAAEEKSVQRESQKEVSLVSILASDKVSKQQHLHQLKS